MSVTVIATPKFRESITKATESLIEIEGYDALLLPFPKESREYIVRCSEGIPLEFSLNELQRLISEPINLWKNSFEPLLKALAQIKEINLNLQEIYCHGDLFFDELLREISVERAILTFRLLISNTIDPEKWREALLKDQDYTKDALTRNADFIVLKTSYHDTSVCVSTDATYLLPRLKEEGYETTLISIERPYPPTPIEVLQEELRRGDVSDERAIELLLLHKKFVREHLLLSENIEEAYQKWGKWKNSFIRQLIFKIKRLGKTR